MKYLDKNGNSHKSLFSAYASDVKNKFIRPKKDDQPTASVDTAIVIPDPIVVETPVETPPAPEENKDDGETTTDATDQEPVFIIPDDQKPTREKFNKDETIKAIVDNALAEQTTLPHGVKGESKVSKITTAALEQADQLLVEHGDDIKNSAKTGLSAFIDKLKGKVDQ